MNAATIVERSSDLETRVSRVFEASPSAVFEAWRDPELFVRWWLPRSMGVALESYQLDVRTGGTYRLNFGGGMEFFGRYIEVVVPSLIVWTNEESGADASVTTVTIEALGAATRLVMTERYPSKEALDAAGMGPAEATHETFAQLDELLKSVKASD
jgi:uncharacterized protein YndB with AHSA1/START domain